MSDFKEDLLNETTGIILLWFKSGSSPVITFLKSPALLVHHGLIPVLSCIFFATMRRLSSCRWLNSQEDGYEKQHW